MHGSARLVRHFLLITALIATTCFELTNSQARQPPKKSAGRSAGKISGSTSTGSTNGKISSPTKYKHSYRTANSDKTEKTPAKPKAQKVNLKSKVGLRRTWAWFKGLLSPHIKSEDKKKVEAIVMATPTTETPDDQAEQTVTSGDGGVAEQQEQSGTTGSQMGSPVPGAAAVAAEAAENNGTSKEKSDETLLEDAEISFLSIDPSNPDVVNATWHWFMEIFGDKANLILQVSLTNSEDGDIDKKHKTDLKRREAFKNNLQRIIDHNQKFVNGQTKFKTAINHKSDMTVEEMKKLNGLVPPRVQPRRMHLVMPRKGIYELFEQQQQQLTSQSLSQQAPSQRAQSPRQRRLKRAIPVGTIVALPKQIDYRKYGYVTSVRTQGACGCCWAITAAGVLEGQIFAYTKKQVTVSEQNFIDCATQPKYNNYGCSGGWPMQALHYSADAGFMLSNNYPYTATDAASGSQCQFNRTSAFEDIVVTGGDYITAGDEKEIMKALYFVGPVASAVNADSWNFIQYSSGIYDDPTCAKDVNHGVLIVGYGVENKVPYWLVKNSWGTDWGEKGYIRIIRNANNVCGIMSWAHYPFVQLPPPKTTARPILIPLVNRVQQNTQPAGQPSKTQAGSAANSASAAAIGAAGGSPQPALTTALPPQLVVQSNGGGASAAAGNSNTAQLLPSGGSPVPADDSSGSEQSSNSNLY